MVPCDEQGTKGGEVEFEERRRKRLGVKGALAGLPGGASDTILTELLAKVDEYQNRKGSVSHLEL